MLYIFDWDGTLCDSLSLITSAIKQSCEQLGFPVRSETENRSIIGLGLKEAMIELYPEQGVNEIDQLVEAYRDVYVSTRNTQSTKLYGGVVQVLDELLDLGHCLAVATGKSRRGLDHVMSELDMHHYFEHSRCADETLSKPHPLMINEILAESGISADQTTMVGDTDFDLLMAKAANVAAVGVSYGAHSLARIEKSEPDRIVDHISELL